MLTINNAESMSLYVLSMYYLSNDFMLLASCFNKYESSVNIENYLINEDEKCLR